MPESTTPTAAEQIAYLKTQGDFEGDSEPTPAAEPTAPTPSTPASAPAPAPKNPANTHTPVLLEAATELGISQEKIDSTPSGELWSYIRYVEDRRDREHRVAQPNRGTAPTEPTAAAAPAAPAAPKPAGLDWGDEADAIIDPEVRSLIERAVKPLLDEIKSLRGDSDQLKQFERGRQLDQHLSVIDRKFANLGPAFEATLGKGARSDLAKDSSEILRRQSVLLMADRLHKAQGENGDYDAAFRQAAHALFGTGSPPASQATPPPVSASKPLPPRGDAGRFTKPAPEIEDWEAAAVATPTNRVQPEAKGNKAAKDFFQQGLREMDARNGTGDETEF